MDTSGAVENGHEDPSTSSAMSKTTTISTIAVQSGKTRIVIALLHCGDWIHLKILEITPELTSLGNTLAEAIELQKAHNEVLRQLQNKQSPVEELLRQADQLIATQKPRAEVYAAMAESLGRAWRDINSTLELRKLILDLNVQYHTKAQDFFEKSEALESACADTIVPVEIEAVKNFLTTIHELRRTLLESLMGALQAGNSLLGKLKELGAEGTLDSRPERIRTSVKRAISQVQGWLDELHVKRQILETTFNRRKIQLEQCLALALLAADLKELEDAIHDRRNLLANSNQLGDSASSAELLLHEHRKLLPEAKQLQERALKITKATEQLVVSGCFAGEQATTQAYIVLSSTSDYLADLQSREHLLERVIAFFRSAQTVLTKLDQLEIQLKTTELSRTSPKLAELHSQCARTIEDASAAPIAEGYTILDLAGNSGGTEGVKKMVQELENMKILLDGLCTAHKEENIKINAALNNFLDRHDQINNWLVTIAEAFLQGHQDMGGDLRLAEDFLQLHSQLQNDLQTKGNEINQLLLTLPPILEYLDDNQRTEVDSKVEGLHGRWMNLKNILERRLELARIYLKFHMEADIVNREMDKLESSIRGREVVDEDTMRSIEDKFESIVPCYQSAKNTGLTFISQIDRISEPHLDIQRARVCVESVLEKLSSRQLNVTKSWQSFRDDVVEKREILVRLERTMAESTKTISWVSKLDSQLYPVITTTSTKPGEIACFLEHKLETVLPDIRKAQSEVDQKIKSAEALIAKAGTSDEKTLSVKNKLSELTQKLVEIASEYQILLQVLIGYFRNLEEIDRKAENFNAQLESQGYPKDLDGIELILREHKVTRETILERFRFAQTECEQIEQRIKKQEPPQSAEHDVSKLQQVLELRRTEFESQYSQIHESFTTLHKIYEFVNETQQINKNINDVSNQLVDVRNQCGESLSGSRAACDNFKQFTRVMETLDLRIIKLKNESEKLQSEVPQEAPEILNQVDDVETKWDALKNQVENTKDVLHDNVRYFELVEEANDWFRDGSKLLVVIARKSTSIKQPEEAEQLLQEINSFLLPGKARQSQRIQEITTLANKIYGIDQRKHAPVISGNKELLESFASIGNELKTLSQNLIAAEVEKQRLLKEQEEARIAEEAKRLEEARLADERRQAEKARIAEEARFADERRRAEEARLAEQKRLAEENLRAEQVRLAEEARIAKEKSLAEEARLAEETRLAKERRRADEARLAEEARKVEVAKLEVEALKAQQIKFLEEAKRAEEERRRIEEEDRRRLEEARIAEEARRAQEAQRLDEERRKDQEERRLEEEKLRAEQIALKVTQEQLKEEMRRAELERLEEEKRIAEQARLQEEKIRDEIAKLEQEKLQAKQARIEEDQRRTDQAKQDQERRLAEEAKLKEMRKTEEARLEEMRRSEKARMEDLRQQDEENRQKRLAEEEKKLEQLRIEEQRRIEEEIRKQHSVQITEITEIHKVESTQREKSPMVEEPLESPIFTTPLSDAVIQEGSKFTFICQVTGHPTPDVTWFKSGVPIENNPDYHTSFDNGLCSLTIEETFAEDSAKYTCKATNSVGIAETSAMLSVKETEPEEQLIAPSFVKMLQPAVAKEGGSFQFECKVEGNPLPTVQWFKNSDCIDNSPDYIINYNNGEAILKFEKVYLEDKAEYSCKAANELGTAQSTANLIVTPLEPTEAPVFLTPLSNVMGRAGQKIKLECEVSGVPQPILTWSHNGKPVKETREQKLQLDGNKATLVIFEAFPKDAGTYAVNASNIAGEASSSCSVSVKGRLPTETSDSEMASDLEPVKPSIQLPLANTTMKEGNRVRLDCVIVGQPEPEVIWYHDNRPVKESSDFQLLFQGDRCSLVIQEALPEDSGEYKVVALNSAGEASSKCILTIEPKEQEEKPPEPSGSAPKFVKLLTDVLVSEGDKVIFEGNVTGEPRPELKWVLNNIPITDTDHFKTNIDEEGNFKLEIETVRPEDKGVYTVKASNPAGEAKCFAQLIVKSFKPADTVVHEEVKSAPVFKELFQDRVAFEETPTKFECIVSGKPTPKTKWLFNGNPISGKDFLISTSGDRQVLSIPVLKKDHQGTITCVAENEAGKASCAASLTVQSSSEIALSEQVLPSSTALVPTTLIPTEMKQHVETSHTSNKEVVTKSSTMSSSKLITSSTGVEPHVEEHKTVLQDAQIFKQVNNEEPQIQKTQRTEEYHKVGKEAPLISEKSSTFISGSQADSTLSTQTKSIHQQQLISKPLRIVRPPKFVSPVIGTIIDQNVDVVLEGILDGQPTPNVTWTKDSKELQESDRVRITFEFNKTSVAIKEANTGDAGRYSCTAVNEAGTAVSTADLVVRKTIFPPVFGRRLQAQVIKKGERLIMEVEVTGTPEPTISWFKDGVPVKDALSNDCRLKSMGQSHTVIIEKADLKHTGRYMVRAVNSGGEAQSIADIAVYEPTPDTMVEVVKTVVFEDVRKHETLASTADKTSSTVSTTKPVPVVPPKVEATPISSEISQSYSTKSEFTSKSEQQTSQQSQTFKLEHKMPEIPLPKPVQRQDHTFEKQTDFEICHGSGLPAGQQEIIEEKKMEIQEGGIETSSISKQSSLQYFVKKIKEGDAPLPSKEVSIPEPIKPEIYQKFSTSESQVKNETEQQPVYSEIRSYETTSSAPATQEFKSFSSTKEVTKELRSEPIKEEYKSFSSSTQKIPEPAKQEYKSFSHSTTELTPKPFSKEFSSFSSVQHISEPQEYKTYSSEVIKEFDLKPEPPAEICYAPTPETSVKKESVFEKMQKISESHNELPPHEVPRGGVKIIPPPPPPKPQKPIESFSEKKELTEKIEKSYQSSSYQTSSSSYSHSYETSGSPFMRKTPEIPPMQKLWSTKHEILERPCSAASSSYSTERHTYSRPLSALSGLGEPSMEGIQMEKQWAHKFSESHGEQPWPPQQSEEPKYLPTWSTQTTLEKKWAPVETKSEKIVQESRTFLDKTPVLVPHYIGEVTRLETTVKDQSYDSFSSSMTENIFEEKNLRPSERPWPPPQPIQQYVAPPPKPYPTIDSLYIRPVSVQDITDEVYLEPGPPPEIGYAEPPKQRRRSYVESIEQDLKRDLQREPTKVLSCAVRTIPPPPLPPKKDFPQAPPLPAKPVKFLPGKPAKKPIQIPYVPFEKFPDLEPFPFRPDPEKPRPPRTGPPPTPSKFIKGRFTDSDYESDFEAVRIPSKWRPSMSDTDEPRYRQVRAPRMVSTGRSRSQEPEPLPPSKFDHPPYFQGPWRPEINFEEFRRKKDASQIKKMTKHFEAVRREVSPPKIKPASPPTYVYPEKKPDSPKTKKKMVIDGYMADTDEPFAQRFLKTEYSSEERTESSHISQSSQKFYESSTQKFSTPKPRVAKFPVKKHHTSSMYSTKKEFVATPIITNQTTEQFTEQLQKETKLESSPYQHEPPCAKKPKGPPPPSPSKFVKGDFRESDYESDYEGRIPPIWGTGTDKHYKPVRPVLTPNQQHYKQSGPSPAPLTEFERPPQTYCPPRPKFEPIEKITPVPKPVVCKPIPVSASSVSDVVVATPAVPPKTVYIQQGPPPEIGYAPGPKKTQYYKSTVSAPYQNAVQHETSNVVHFDESTDTCHRTMSVQQTHKVIKFGDQYKRQEKKLEQFPYSPEPDRTRRATSVPPPPTPTKFIPGEFRDTDYESEVESTRIKTKWTPSASDTEDIHYRRVQAPTPSRWQGTPSVPYGRIQTPMEFDQSPQMPSHISTTVTKDYTDGETRRQQSTSFKRFSETSSNQLSKRSHSYEPPAKLKPGTPPEYGYVADQRLSKSTATKMATHHMDSMTKDFKSKTQKFVTDIMNDVNQKQQRNPILKSGADGDAQVYREESRAMSHGTKHVDPDTGLIYFKYDFGYEFGIILPGESKAGGIPVPKKTVIEPPKRTVDIDMPVYHETTKSNDSNHYQAPTPQFKPKKFTTKWDPTSESEMSEYEGDTKKRSGLNPGSRWEPSSCSPMSLSPSLPSTSPAFNHAFADSGRAPTPPSCPSTPGSIKLIIQPGQPRAPMFITPLRDIAVVSGQAAKFECIVQSEPPPNILWSKNGRIIENSHDYQIHYRNGVCRLTIAQAYPEDAGTYTCTASNPVGSTNTTATLQVPGERRSQYLK